MKTKLFKCNPNHSCKQMINITSKAVKKPSNPLFQTSVSVCQVNAGSFLPFIAIIAFPQTHQALTRCGREPADWWLTWVSGWEGLQKGLGGGRRQASGLKVQVKRQDNCSNRTLQVTCCMQGGGGGGPNNRRGRSWMLAQCTKVKGGYQWHDVSQQMKVSSGFKEMLLWLVYCQTWRRLTVQKHKLLLIWF